MNPTTEQVAAEITLRKSLTTSEQAEAYQVIIIALTQAQADLISLQRRFDLLERGAVDQVRWTDEALAELAEANAAIRALVRALGWQKDYDPILLDRIDINPAVKRAMEAGP